MKIKIDNNCFEDLSEYTYLYKRDVFRRKNLYYKYKLSCAECGKPFFMRITYPTNFCSKICANKSKEVRSKISKSLTGIKRTKKECIAISKRMSKGDVVRLNIPLYNTYAKQLEPVEETKDIEDVLYVRCSLCGKWFMPKRTIVDMRAQYIKGNIDRENRFYCSDTCKNNCPIFNKRKYPAGSNPRKHRNKNKLFTDYELAVWSREVLKRANYICEFCGSNATIAHHELPKKTNPFFALDPINGVACCSECHNKYGHRDKNCLYISLANKKCT